MGTVSSTVVGIDSTVGVDTVAVTREEASSPVVGNKPVYDVDLPGNHDQAEQTQQHSNTSLLLL